jgi:hypothetical protein
VNRRTLLDAQFARSPAAAPAERGEADESVAVDGSATRRRAAAPMLPKATQAARSPESASVSPGEAVSAAPAPPAAAERRPAPSAETLADLQARAVRAYRDGRWAEAAAAYRELRRRFPEHREASEWLRRQRIAEQAAEQGGSLRR